MTSCSVITISYHTGPVLFASVKTVLKQQGLAELIVVDNGNPPDVLARLQQMALSEPRLKILTGGGNVGFAKACNAGTKIATGTYLLLLNPDCLLPPDALVHTVAALETYPSAKLAGAHMINPDGSEQRGGRRQLLTPKTALTEALGLHYLFNTGRLNEHETPMPGEIHEVPAVSGAFMCLKKTDYNRLAGLDEEFFLHVEDLDICMRVAKMGGKVIVAPQVKVTHMLSTSGETTSRAIEWQKARGFIHYFHKHFRGQYFPGFLWLIDAGILARYALRVLRRTVFGKMKHTPLLHHSMPAKRLMILASGLTDLPETKQYHDKTVLVTGATGQVGLCIVRRLLAGGASVLALSRSGEAIPYWHEQLRWIKADLADPGLSLNGYLVDIVVHCAPLWHLPPMLDLLANSEVKRIVAFGSTSVFAKAHSANSYEKNLVAKLIQAEAALAEECPKKNISWTVFRPTLIYGVGLDVNVTTLAKLIHRFGFFPVYPPAFGRRQPVHADDLALAVIQAIPSENAYGKAYNVSGGEVVTYKQMLERLFVLCRKKKRILETTLLPFVLDVLGRILHKPHINGEIARRMNDDLMFFHDEAKKDFGYHPRAFLSGGIKDLEGF